MFTETSSSAERDRAALLVGMREMYKNILAGSQAEQVRSDIVTRLKSLERDYHESCKNYCSYYVLKGDPVPENLPETDFPGDDSVMMLLLKHAGRR